MLPLWVLAILSIVSAVLELPHDWVHHPIFSGFMQQVLPATNTVESGMSEAVHQLLASPLNSPIPSSTSEGIASSIRARCGRPFQRRVPYFRGLRQCLRMA